MTAAILFGTGGEAADDAPPRIDPPLDASPAREGPVIGFVTHPHEGISRSRIDLLSDFPATAELSNVFAWRMREGARPESVEEIDVDFRTPELWLREIYRSGRLALPILDTGIHHSEEAWRAALTERAGENLVGIDGQERGWSSFHSPVYRKSVFSYVDQIIDWVKQNDHAGRVPAYINGAEWFWPWGTMDYSTMALDAFRGWLENRYGSLDSLNAAWGATFAGWGEVEPVRAYALGEWAVGKRTFSFGEPARYAWESPAASVSPGRIYEASAVVEVEDVPEGLVDLTFVWLDADGHSIAPWHAAAFSLDRDSTGGGEIHGEAVAPENAVAARLALKLWGSGRAEFRKVVFRDRETGVSLLPAEGGPGEDTDSWQFTEMGDGDGHFARRDDQPVLEIVARDLPLPHRFTGVAHSDWIEFSYESMAEWLSVCARHIKQRDPDRPVVSYIGWIFGMHNMWDGVQEEQRFDISLVNTPDIDINGFQLAIAGDDYTYATFNIDLARKYGTPMWGTDLVDFPYGLFSGFNPIYRASLACAQRGLSGFFYYNWHGTYDYSYSEHLSDAENRRLISDVKEAVSGLEGHTLQTEVAQILPILAYSLADPDGYKGDMLDAGGLYRLVLDMGLTPDIWTPYEIEKLGSGRLSKYRVAFLSDCPVLPEEVNASLVAFVRGGGTLVGSGRPPAHDMRGQPLKELLVPPQAQAEEETIRRPLGAGKVVWQTQRIGRDYIGSVRRVRVYGNTPAVFVEQPDPRRTPTSQWLARRELDRLLDEAEVYRPVRIDLSHGTIHVASWQNDANGDWQLFLVNRSGGRVYDPVLRLDTDLFGREASVLVDMERTREISAEEDGVLKLPSFAHSAIVTVPARRDE